MTATAVAFTHRIRRIRALARDLECWSVRERVPVAGWRCDGQLLAPGGAWATSRRLSVITHSGMAVPAHWPIDSARLRLSGFGYGELRLRDAAGRVSVAAVNEHHESHRIPAHWFAAAMTVAPVRDRDTGYVTLNEPGEAELVWLEAAVGSLTLLIECSLDTARACPSTRAAHDLLAGVETALAAITWPTDARRVLPRQAAAEYLDGLWSPAEFEPTPGPLTQAERASLETAASLLTRALREIPWKDRELRAVFVGSAHFDPSWLWPLAVSEPAIVGHFGTAASQLERYPAYRFGQSAAHLYHILGQRDPDLFARIRALVRSDRWELLSGMWSEADLNLPSGESLVRQFLYGQRYLEKEFGRRSRLCWLPDSFGFSAALPQILAGAGVEYFYTTKLRYNDSNPFPYDFFRWHGLDGTSVLAFAAAGPSGYRGDPRLATVIATLGSLRNSAAFPAGLLPLGHSSGIGPTDCEVERALAYSSLPSLPVAQFGSVASFFDDASKAFEDRLPSWNGELYLEAHRGTYTAQGRTKVAHRTAESNLLQLEATGAIAYTLGAGELARYEHEWRVLLEQQAHDVVTGVSIAEVHRRAEALLGSLALDARERTQAIAARLARRLTGSAAGPDLLLVNPTLRSREAKVFVPGRDDCGQPVEGGCVLTAPVSVPPLGARVISALSPGYARAEPTRLANDKIIVEIDQDGLVASVVDRETGRNCLGGPGNRLRAYLDRSHFWDAWELARGYLDLPMEDPRLVERAVLESGPHRAAIRLCWSFRSSSVQQDIRLWSGSRRLDFATTIDWHERRTVLRAAFPLPGDASYAVRECAFGVVPAEINPTPEYQQARFEVPAQRFADVGDGNHGVAVLNNGRYGHSISGNEIGITLLRSPVFPDPTADEGTHAFTYSLLPHRGDWVSGGVLAEADDLNATFPTAACTAPSGAAQWSFFEVSGDSSLAALKAAEDAESLVMRVYNPRDTATALAVTPPPGWQIGSPVNLLEEPSDSVPGDLGPFQVASFLVERVSAGDRRPAS